MRVLKAYQEAFKSQKRYIVLRGGAGSGKSYFAAQKIITRIMSEENHRVLIIRKVGATLKNSVFSLFQEIIIGEGLSSNFIMNKSDYSIECKLNRNKILCSGLDDAEKIKSIAGITSMWIEEATELSEIEWDQLQLRIRGKQTNYVQFILTFNPISEEHWLKSVFFDRYDENVYTLVTTYKDNSFLSEEDIKHFEERLIKNSRYWLIYGKGEWGNIQTGGEMVDKFDYSYHVKPLLYNPELPIHISLDFNVQPHCSMAIIQIENNVIKVIDEIAQKHPKNRTVDMCQEFCNRYKQHVGGLFVYGDQSGLHNDTRSEEGFNDYSIVKRELNRYKPQLRIQSKNPSVSMSTNFLNDIMMENDKLKIIIDPRCKKLINDLLYLKQNSEGGKLIQYEKHPVTEVRYEKYGHFFDLLRYFLVTCYSKEYIMFQREGKPYSTIKCGSIKEMHSDGNGKMHQYSKNSY